MGFAVPTPVRDDAVFAHEVAGAEYHEDAFFAREPRFDLLGHAFVAFCNQRVVLTV